MKMPEHARTRMFHVTLHPYAEIDDQYFWGIPPSGSLLVWIDRFLSKPETTRDRTAGRLKNLLMFADETPTDLRKRVHIKAFPFKPGALPQHHGGFLFATPNATPDAAFWCEPFWMPDGASTNTQCRAPKPETEAAAHGGSQSVNVVP